VVLHGLHDLRLPAWPRVRLDSRLLSYHDNIYCTGCLVVRLRSLICCSAVHVRSGCLAKALRAMNLFGSATLTSRTPKSSNARS
jgi:hypothetical protein